MVPEQAQEGQGSKKNFLERHSAIFLDQGVFRCSTVCSYALLVLPAQKILTAYTEDSWL